MINFLHVVKNMGAKGSLTNSTFHSFGHQEKGKKKKKAILTFFMVPSWKILGKDSLKQLESGKLHRVMKQHSRSCGNHKDGDKGEETSGRKGVGWGAGQTKQEMPVISSLIDCQLNLAINQFHSFSKYLFTHLLSICYLPGAVLDLGMKRWRWYLLRMLGIQKYKNRK